VWKFLIEQRALNRPSAVGSKTSVATAATSLGGSTAGSTIGDTATPT
jgi:hypothetical protein